MGRASFIEEYDDHDRGYDCGTVVNHFARGFVVVLRFLSTIKGRRSRRNDRGGPRVGTTHREHGACDGRHCDVGSGTVDADGRCRVHTPFLKAKKETLEPSLRFAHSKPRRRVPKVVVATTAMVGYEDNVLSMCEVVLDVIGVVRALVERFYRWSALCIYLKRDESVS